MIFANRILSDRINRYCELKMAFFEKNKFTEKSVVKKDYSEVPDNIKEIVDLLSQQK